MNPKKYAQELKISIEFIEKAKGLNIWLNECSVKGKYAHNEVSETLYNYTKIEATATMNEREEACMDAQRVSHVKKRNDVHSHGQKDGDDGGNFRPAERRDRVLIAERGQKRREIALNFRSFQSKERAHCTSNGSTVRWILIGCHSKLSLKKPSFSLISQILEKRFENLMSAFVTPQMLMISCRCHYDLSRA